MRKHRRFTQVARLWRLRAGRLTAETWVSARRRSTPVVMLDEVSLFFAALLSFQGSWSFCPVASLGFGSRILQLSFPLRSASETQTRLKKSEFQPAEAAATSTSFYWVRTDLKFNCWRAEILPFSMCKQGLFSTSIRGLKCKQIEQKLKSVCFWNVNKSSKVRIFER